MKKWAIFIMLIPIACLFLVGCGEEETKASREESCDELTEDIMFFSEHSDGFSGGSRAGVEVTLHYDAEERMVKEESYIFGKGIDEEAKSKNGVQDSLQIPEDVRTAVFPPRTKPAHPVFQHGDILLLTHDLSEIISGTQIDADFPGHVRPVDIRRQRTENGIE